MSFIRCATLIAPNTANAVEGSATAGLGAGAADLVRSGNAAAGFWAEFMDRERKKKTGMRPTSRRGLASVGTARFQRLTFFVEKVTK
ncbi:hypothetical protein [Achromobacter dolens]|uniref:hypothetical protein n=1 Tax=Achromobacter dolens TaxID=1287738 RepID=UPI001F081C4E|nr:hypothetical protein [Achromobacter dolens]